MIKSPGLWGAGLACALGGAIAGNALGSTPPLDRSVLAEFYQSHAFPEGLAPSGERPPDHYPLVTRSGIVPVGELGMRGLYSQARYRARVYPAFAASEISGEDDGPGEAWRPESAEAALTASANETQADLPRAPASPDGPLQLAGGPAEIPTRGAAKTIDVDTALAMR